MQKPQAFLFYTNDWLTSARTRMMTLEQRGAYVDLLAYQWQSGGLPDNDNALSVLSGFGLRWLQDSNNIVIRSCFSKCNDGLLRNQKLEKVRDEYETSRRLKSEGGKKGMKNRYSSAESKIDITGLQDSYNNRKEKKGKELKELKEQKKKSLKIKISSFTPEQRELAESLKSSILLNDPKAKIADKQVEQWAEIVRLMIEKDKRTLLEISEVLQWVVNDEFWKSNILSMNSLRKHFTKLVVKIKSNRPQSKGEARLRNNIRAGQIFAQEDNNDNG